MQSTTERLLTARCPECEQDVALPADPLEGEIVACASCEAELELASVEPALLQLAPEVEEDWGE